MEKRKRGRPAKLTRIRNGILVRACPCPNHDGEFLPLDSEHFHKGGNGGFQSYCRKYRNAIAAKRNQRVRKEKKAPILCKICTEKKPPTKEFWQKDARRGWRQPCKACIHKRIQEKKNKTQS